MEAKEARNDENLDELIYDTHTYRKIFELEKNKTLKNYYNVYRYIEEGCFFVQNFQTNDFDFFFYEPITIHYKLKEHTKNFPNIYSTAQIEKYNKTLCENPFIVHDNIKIDYKIAKNKIFKYIINKEIEICNDISNYDIFDLEHNILDDDRFQKKDFSKYFNDYFVYNNSNEEIFIYDDTENRKILKKKYLMDFFTNKNIHFFKFCGPSSTGKSTTLLKLSKERVGTVYLNLKKIHKFEEKGDKINSYNLIIYEFRRLYLNNEKLNTLKDLLQKNINNPIWTIIINILNYIKDTYNTIIFDQFKKSYISIDDFNKIENIIKDSNLRLILCSSINNWDIRDEVIKTIKKYNGNPKELDDQSQYYYFYFYQDFFGKTINDNNEDNLKSLYQLFNFKPKYIYLLSQCKNDYKICINEIKSQIKKKMEEFFLFEKNLNICKILLIIKNNINIKLSYDKDIDILINIPLKYYALKLEKDYFVIEYAFDFIHYIQKEYITKEECDNYFQLKKYEIDKSFDGKIKGEFFEMAARFFIQDSKVLPAKIDNIINVKNIVGMEPLLEVKSIDNILNDINLDIIKENIDIKKIEENDIKKVRNILKEKKIITKEDLDNHFKDTKNIEYFYINSLLNFYSKKNKINNITNDDDEEDNQNKEEKEDEDEEEDKKEKEIKEYQNKAKKKKSKNKSKESIDKVLKRKTKRDENDNIINSKKIKNIKNNNILLEQEQINGKALDQGFIYNINNNGEEKHIFIGLQMKCLSDNTDHSSLLKKITKKKIKENIQNILIRSKLDYNINFDEWHYYIVAYYNKLDKNSIFCRQLNRHCKSQDIAIIYYDPIDSSLYINKNNKFDKILEISISNLSNLDFDFTESNPYHIIDNEFKEELINSYYTQRSERINNENNHYNKRSELEEKYSLWLKNCQKDKDDVEKSIQKSFEIKNLKVLDCYKLICEMPLPCPSENHLFLFVNNEKSDFIGFLRNKKFEAKSLGTGNDIKIIDLPKFINTDQQEFFVFYFN